MVTHHAPHRGSLSRHDANEWSVANTRDTNLKDGRPVGIHRGPRSMKTLYLSVREAGQHTTGAN